MTAPEKGNVEKLLELLKNKAKDEGGDFYLKELRALEEKMKDHGPLDMTGEINALMQQWFLEDLKKKANGPHRDFYLTELRALEEKIALGPLDMAKEINAFRQKWDYYIAHRLARDLGLEEKLDKTIAAQANK